MAIFTAIAAAIGLTGFFASAFVTAASIAASIGLSYAVKALTGSPEGSAQQQQSAGMQGTLQAGGAVARAFPLGASASAGSLTYANYHGGDSQTPNAYLTQVIALSDLPGCKLTGTWVNGQKCTFSVDAADAGGFAGDSPGYPLPEFYKPRGDSGPSVPHLWLRYHDGTQTAADGYVVGQVSSSDRPYGATRVGAGIAYVVVTMLENDKLFTGFPTFLFETSSIPLYDPSRDSSVGGSGSQRYADPATWGGDGDDLPAVQIYNLLRGFRYDGGWLYGLQNTSAARLPLANWLTQIDKCRDTIQGEDGLEPTYRAGGFVAVSAQPANVIETYLTACQGRLSEIGGFYKLHVGAPDNPSFAFSDDDILSTEEQTFRPFFALADSVNGIQGTYPDPAQAWATATAPAYYRTDLEARDGHRRLMANPAFDVVPYAAQVQRLQKSAVEEAQRARAHSIVLPPSFWFVEPGDVGEWTSARNGYDAKQFRVDGMVDKANLDVALSLTEVDPSDYDWDHATDFTPVTSGPTIIVYPPPQGVVAFDAEGYALVDADGVQRRSAIRLTWDASLPGIKGVLYEVRLKSDHSDAGNGATDQYSAGALIITHNLIPNTEYQVRGQYVPTWPRDMLWSGWLDVTTPDVGATLADFDAAIRHRVTTAFDQMADLARRVDVLTASLAKADLARNWLDKREVRRELASVSGAANARITEVFTVATDLQTALAQTQLELTSDIGAANARIDITNTTVADLSQSFADQTQSFNSQFGSVNGQITTEIQTRSTADGALSARIDSLKTQTDNSFASVNQQIVAESNSISALAAQQSSFSTTLNGHTSTLQAMQGSVNGASVYWGLIGTIDGTTGGLVFTGVRGSNGVNYQLALSGNLLIAGSMSAYTGSIGSIFGGSLTSLNGKTQFDLNAGRLIISD